MSNKSETLLNFTMEIPKNQLIKFVHLSEKDGKGCYRSMKHNRKKRSMNNKNKKKTDLPLLLFLSSILP